MEESKKSTLLKDLGQFSIIIVVFVVGMFGYGAYMNRDQTEKYSTSNNSVETDIENNKLVHEGKASKVECTWCGGVGRVGYAGASEAQVRRTGMGLGNYCTTCSGTGKIEVRKK
ncbi:MAG: hypothetical protein V4687_06785 [Bacteroidota bacterium]